MSSPFLRLSGFVTVCLTALPPEIPASLCARWESFAKGGRRLDGVKGLELAESLSLSDGDVIEALCSDHAGDFVTVDYLNNLVHFHFLRAFRLFVLFCIYYTPLGVESQYANCTNFQIIYCTLLGVYDE